MPAGIWSLIYPQLPFEPFCATSKIVVSCGRGRMPCSSQWRALRALYTAKGGTYKEINTHKGLDLYRNPVRPASRARTHGHLHIDFLRIGISTSTMPIKPSSGTGYDLHSCHPRRNQVWSGRTSTPSLSTSSSVRGMGLEDGPTSCNAARVLRTNVPRNRRS